MSTDPATHLTPVLVKIDDGSVWASSYESEGWAMAEMFRPTWRIFLRELERVRNPDRRWWCPWRSDCVYRQTGRTMQIEDEYRFKHFEWFDSDRGRAIMGGHQ